MEIKGNSHTILVEGMFNCLVINYSWYLFSYSNLQEDQFFIVPLDTVNEYNDIFLESPPSASVVGPM